MRERWYIRKRVLHKTIAKYTQHYHAAFTLISSILMFYLVFQVIRKLRYSYLPRKRPKMGYSSR